MRTPCRNSRQLHAGKGSWPPVRARRGPTAIDPCSALWHHLPGHGWLLAVHGGEVMTDSGVGTFQPDAGTPKSFPPSLLAWLPLLWSGVLFPGTTTDRSAIRRRSLLLLFILPGILLYPCFSF